jgi:cold shock CspA family protein
MTTGVGFRTLTEGAKVEYQLRESPTALQATNVRAI